MARFSIGAVFQGLVALLLLPVRAPLLLLLFGISVYLGLHWGMTDANRTLASGPWAGMFWSIDCLHAVLVVFVCTMPDLLLQRVSNLMAASRVVSLVVTLLIVTIGGLYLLHLNVLTPALILASSVLLARLDLLRVRMLPPPLVAALSFSALVLVGVSLGRHLALSLPA